MPTQRVWAALFPVKISTTDRRLINAGAVLFWLSVWQVLAMAVGEEILLVSPLKVVIRLTELVREKDFYSSIVFSAVRILSGFALGVCLAIISAVLSSRSDFMRILMKPLVSFLKATPVASIVIVVLIWVSSRTLSVAVSFMMVFPIMYASLLSGFDSVDSKLTEMCSVFRVPFMKRVRAVYMPAVLPHFISSSVTAMGLAWKSGVAAEVIGLPDGSLGERLYEAKTYLASADVFALTVTIIAVSVLFEKLFSCLVRRLAVRYHIA